MTTQLENMKYLRSIGASIKLQDDVAKKVGGYDSPLFVPTVEFIIKLQSIFSSKSQNKQQVAGLPNTFNPIDFKGIDLEEVKDQLKQSDMQKKQKKQAVKYVDGMIDQRDKFLDKNREFDADENQIPRKKKDKKQQVKDAGVKKKSGVISFIISSIKSALDNITQQNAQQKQQAELLQQNQIRNNQRRTQLQNQVKNRESQRKSRLQNFISSIIRTKHDAELRHDMTEHADDIYEHEHAEQPQRASREDFLAKLKENPQIKDLQAKYEKSGQKLGDKELIEFAKQSKTQLTEVNKELTASKMIDQIIKNADGKLNGSKQTSIDEVAGKLQNIGIRPITSADQQIDNKKTLAEIQPQTEKQRS